MGEGAPRPKETREEKGPEGSITDYMDEVKARTNGIENAMKGIGEAAGVVQSIEKLGKLGGTFPEFQHWVNSRLTGLEKLSKKAEKENVSEPLVAWQDRVDAVFRKWDGESKLPGKEELWLHRLGLLRTAIANTRSIEYQGREIKGGELEEVKEENLEEIDSIENKILFRNSEEQTDRIMRLGEFWKIFK